MAFRAEKSPGASGTLPQAAMPARPAPPPMPSFKKPRPVRTASLWRNPRFRIRMPRRDLSTPPARGINRRFRCMNSGLYRGSLVYGRAETGCFPGFFNELGNAGHLMTAKGACQKPLRDRKLPGPFQPDFFWGNSPRRGRHGKKNPGEINCPQKLDTTFGSQFRRPGFAQGQNVGGRRLSGKSSLIRQVRHLSSKFDIYPASSSGPCRFQSVRLASTRT